MSSTRPVFAVTKQGAIVLRPQMGTAKRKPAGRHPKKGRHSTMRNRSSKSRRAMGRWNPLTDHEEEVLRRKGLKQVVEADLSDWPSKDLLEAAGYWGARHFHFYTSIMRKKYTEEGRDPVPWLASLPEDIEGISERLNSAFPFRLAMGDPRIQSMMKAVAARTIGARRRVSDVEALALICAAAWTGLHNVARWSPAGSPSARRATKLAVLQAIDVVKSLSVWAHYDGTYELREEARRKPYWPVLIAPLWFSKRGKRALSVVEKLLVHLEVGQSSVLRARRAPGQRKILNPTTPANAWAIELLAGLHAAVNAVNRSFEKHLNQEGRKRISTLRKAGAFSGATWRTWATAAWKEVMEKSGGKPEITHPRYARLGKRRERHMDKRGKIYASHTREGMRTELFKAFERLAHPQRRNTRSL